MVRKIFTMIGKEIRGLHEAAYLLGIFTILSQLLGFIRDRMLASSFGAGYELDVYYASFRIPDLIFVTVSSLVSVSVLIPFLIEKIGKGKEESRAFINSIFTVFTTVIVGVGIITFFLIPYLLKIMVPALLDGPLGADLVTMTRILLLSPILLGLSNLCGSVTQAYKKFVLYAISPILYNAGIIFGIFFIYPKFGITGLVWGVIGGALMHFLIQIPTLVEHKLVPRFSFSFSFSSIKEVLLLSIPRTLTLASSQIALVLLVGLASYMAAGSISIFNFSFNLQSVPMSIIGVSYSLAAFPTLARFFSSGETKKFLEHVTTAARHIIFWSIPITILFVVLRAQIVRTVLGAGSFSWADTRLTAAALALFAMSVVFQSLILLFVRAYYAAGETKRPLVINIISSVLIMVWAYVFVYIFNTYPVFMYFIEHLLKVEDLPGTSVLMLPLAYSVATIINGIILWASFGKKFKGFSAPLWKPLFDSLSASLIMGFVVYQFLDVFDDIFNISTLFGIFFQGLCAGIMGIISAVIILKLLNNEEIEIVWNTMHKKIWKAKVIVPEQTEIEV